MVYFQAYKSLYSPKKWERWENLKFFAKKKFWFRKYRNWTLVSVPDTGTWFQLYTNTSWYNTVYVFWHLLSSLDFLELFLNGISNFYSLWTKSKIKRENQIKSFDNVFWWRRHDTTLTSKKLNEENCPTNRLWRFIHTQWGFIKLFYVCTYMPAFT